MRYSLEKDNKGRITQCDNGDGNNNVWSKRKELNKQAIENLARPTPGKLGGLSNLQVFNFEISSFSAGTQAFVIANYNEAQTFPSNMTQTVMFGTDSTTDQALYYNIVGLNVKLGGEFSGSGVIRPSLISFYLLQNIPGFTGSSGTKIPQPASLIGAGGGAVTFTTTGADFGNQSVSIDLSAEQGLYAQNNDTKGLRCSGLALRQIYLLFGASLDTANITLDVEVYVDRTSVSTTY